MTEQLIKKTGEGYSNVMPKSWIEAITDKSTGESLTHILQGFNMYFLSYTGNTEQTRCQVPKILRKKGLWITYVKYDGNVYTEWYNSNNIDDKSWGNSSNWRIGNNELVGDLTISANGNWVINDKETEFKAIGEKGNTPVLRVANNRLQVSYDTGNTYHNVDNNPVYTQIRTYNNKLQISTDLGANWIDASDEIAAYFRFNSGQGNNVGNIQISRNNKDWSDLSSNFVNNLHISKYIGADETLPTSGVAEGTIYAKGPTYADSDTSHSNPIYRLWVYAYKGNTLAWQDNGEFTSISAGVVQELGDSENLVMSQKAVSEKLSEVGGKVNELENKIQPINSELSRKSNNLFNKNDVTVGKYQPNNVYYLIDQASYSASNFIPVEEGEIYSISANRQGAFFKDAEQSQEAFYGSIGNSNTFTVPATVKYVRISVFNTEKDTFMMNKGSELLPYEPAQQLLKMEALADDSLDKIQQYLKTSEYPEFIKDKLEEISRFVIGRKSYNLFDKNNVTAGKYQPTNAGYLIDNADFCASDFISVEVGNTYTISEMTFAAFFNSNKDYVSSAGTSDTFTVPSGVAYIRLSVRNTEKETFMMNEGETLLPYEKYGVIQIKEDTLPQDVINYIKKNLDLSADFIIGIPSNNLFDKTKVTPNKFQPTNTYYLIDSNTHCVSELIPVKEGHTYSLTVNRGGAYFSNNQPSNDSYGGNIGISRVFTVPTGMRYVRFSVLNEEVDTFMMNEGSELLPYEHAEKLLPKETISPQCLNKIKNSLPLKSFEYKDIVLEHLYNPFIKTKIKLLGDSITAGVGGTGYDPNGEVMTDGRKANVLTAVSWANMLYHYVNEQFNKDVLVPMDNINIIKPCNTSSNQQMQWTYTEEIEGKDTPFTTDMRCIGLKDSNEEQGNDFVKFTFYGTHFSVYIKTGDAGKFKVIVDDVEVGTIDCYSASEVYEVEMPFSGLSEGNHNVKFQTTGEHNVAATKNEVSILYLKIPKCAIVKPWGLSGEMSAASAFRLESDDDIVILQYGTNDRHPCVSPEHTQYCLSNTINRVLEYGHIPIVMCANPCTREWEYNVPRRFHMWDVRNAIELTAKKYEIPFVDNYTAFLDYAEQHNIQLTDMLAEGLHPNDLGYKVMYENIMKTLGLSLIPNYSE